MGRNKKQTALTQEQIDFRNSILRGKIRVVKDAEKYPAKTIPFKSQVEPQQTKEDEIKKCFFYLNNCVYWINEYVDGNIDKSRLLQTAIAIQGNAKKLEMLCR